MENDLLSVHIVYNYDICIYEDFNLPCLDGKLVYIDDFPCTLKISTMNTQTLNKWYRWEDIWAGRYIQFELNRSNLSDVSTEGL